MSPTGRRSLSGCAWTSTWSIREPTRSSRSTLDWDGKIRMDCSSPCDGLAGCGQDQYQVATGNDADSDRHGIVTPDAGLMNPNHYLSVAIDYLLSHRDGWSPQAGVGKTLVSSSMIDRVVASRGRSALEVPVGFKWFVPGLLSGTWSSVARSPLAPFLRKNGTTWTTDKDGILLALLASEIIATTGQTPSQHYAALTEQYGTSHYARIDAPADRERKPSSPGWPPTGHRTGTGRGPHHCGADQRSGQRCGDRWAEGADRERMVRGAAVGH